MALKRIMSAYKTSYLTALWIIPSFILASTQHSKDSDTVKNSHLVNWRGYYLNGKIGEGSSHSHLDFRNANYFNTLGPQLLGTKFHFNSDGFVGGGALGYNLQVQRLVIGLEVGALSVRFKKDIPSPFFPDVDVYSYDQKWLADAKARLGLVCWRLLPFITGGWAGSQIDLKLRDTQADIVAHLNKWVIGWTIGGGIDCMIVRHFSLGLAYDYYRFDYNNKAVHCSSCGMGIGLGSPVVSDHIYTHILTARINIHL